MTPPQHDQTMTLRELENAVIDHPLDTPILVQCPDLTIGALVRIEENRAGELVLVTE